MTQEKPTYEELEQRVRQIKKACFANARSKDDLLRNRKLVEDIIENSSALIVIKNCEGTHLLVNRKWEETTGLNREAVLGKSDDMLFPQPVARQFRRNDLLVIASGAAIQAEETLDTPSGVRYFLSNKFPLFNTDDDIIGLCGISTDITERKWAEETLRQNEKKYLSLFHNAQIALFKTSLDGKIIEINQRYCELAGYTSMANCMAHFRPGEAWADPQRRAELIRILREKGAVRDFEAEIVRNNGEHIWIIFSGRFIPEENAVEGSIIDITARKKTEQSLRESEARFKALHNASFGGIAIHDKGIILECNQGLSDISGYTQEELIGKDGLLLLAEESRDLARSNILRGYEKPYEVLGLRKNGEVYPLRLEARNIPYKGITVRTVELRDISENKRAEEERKKLQDQLTQAQKMESVGRLAGGVAHDFNNMLSVIMGYAELAIEEVTDASPIHSYLKEINDAARRSMEITRQLMAFARQQTVAPRVLDLNATIESMLKMLQRLIGEDIHLAWHPQPGLWPVCVDPAQVDQILANLCVNARDAIADVGRVTITTSNITVAVDQKETHIDVTPGAYVLLTFSDDGSGMTANVLNNLFEPFFTTKDINAGTGLGLATVYGIVKQNKGFIDVKSEPGKGATFRIYLPRSMQDANPEPVAGASCDSPIAQGNETILLVEDEPSLLAMTRDMLKKLGYSVIAAKSPSEAIDIAGKREREIHLLITDVVMPHMNGRDLAEQLMAANPQLKCLFMSGYTADVIAHHGILNEKVQFIAKPFSLDELASKVREVMDRVRQPGPDAVP